jgi:Glycerol-3-phosphate dehydrogenase
MSVTSIVRANFAGADAFDLLIIGGGITGAALAHEATSRGLTVALVEKGDFGAATSAATGKLIHGGLRYLKKLEVGLVRESLAERRNLMRIAPNLVSPIPIVLPETGVVEQLGLTAYDVLSFDRNRLSDPSKRIGAHRLLSRRGLDELGLDYVGKGILYYDAMMLSPERLTLAFLRTAVAAGAQVANYVRVDRLVMDGQRVTGAEITDQVNGGTGLIRAKVTINATGAWAHDLLSSTPQTQALAGPAPKVRSEGIYLVTRKLSDVMVLTVGKHGHFSFAPWRGHSLVGPTETPYHGPVDQWRLSRASIDAFLTSIAANNTAGVKLTIDDVVSAYGGLRPLTESAEVDTYTASRASELIDHSRQGVTGLVSAMGGKYTSSRAFASRIVTALGRQLGGGLRSSRTALTPLDGCQIADLPAEIAAARAAAAADGLKESAGEVLAQLYGSQRSDLMELMADDDRLRLPGTPDGEPLATVAWAAKHEAVAHLSDALLRRTGIGQLGDPGPEVLNAAADIVAVELGWSAQKRSEELDAARRAVSLPQD